MESILRLAGKTINPGSRINSRARLQDKLQANFENFELLTKSLDQFEREVIANKLEVPFRIDCDRLRQLHPRERIEIRKANRQCEFLTDE